jgi:D-alanyl-D-alanine-carboxypeptidase/D-alanyl-D-alanine-endopeptidase
MMGPRTGPTPSSPSPAPDTRRPPPTYLRPVLLDDFRTYLASAKLAYTPGRAAAYSNVGYGVLGEALVGAGGKSYADLLRERVTGPLGMRTQCSASMRGSGPG